MSVVVALLLDAWWREPPSPAHPVVAMGAYLQAAGRRIPSVPRRRAHAGGAENLSDSLVAPLVWFVVAGLPGAAVYRYVNTADEMWGYRSQDWCWAGTAAARADDLANLLPARLTALLLAAPAVAVPVLRREAARTASPNAGWPMAALALRLGVRLPKRGVYVVNPAGRQPGAADAAAAVLLVWHAGLVAGAAAVAVSGVTRERVWRRG